MKGITYGMPEIQRWYDKIPRLREIFLILKNANGKERNSIAGIFYRIILEHKRENRNHGGLRSSGKEKILGYYKAYGKRRWYDKNQYLINVAKSLSIMERPEIEDILDEFYLRLEEEGLVEFFQQKKSDLSKLPQE